MSWELTDAGRLYEALCSGPGWALVDGTWVRATGTGRLFSDGVGCVLLGGLTGYVKMPEFSSLPTTVSMLTPVPDITDPVLIASRNAVVDSQRDTLGNPAFGVPLRSGPHAMRLVSVTDDLGRMLHFSYGSSGVEKGMLQSVTGPAGASVTFTYQNPVGQSALPVPEGLNELFLRRAMRTDVATSDPEVLAAGGRGFEFQYAFERTDQMPNDITTALTAYRDFFRSVYNCGFQTRDQCGKLYAAGAMFVNLDALLDAQRRRLFSEAADNITTVTVKDEAGGVGYIESETRYASNVYDEHFDKVRAQRWGSVADPSLQAVQNHPQLPFTWQTALPLATFDYQEAVPRSTSSGVLTGDETDDFLPQHLRTRYPLEVAAGPAIQMSWNKGLLLPAHSPAGLPPANRLPMLAVDSPQVSVDGQLMPGCGLSRLPELRTRLPGYQPSLDYYDRTLPTANLPTPGVSWTQGLERSRVSCNTLALALTYDVTHNDLASTWQKAMNGDYVFETMTGRRAHIAANANRICAWSRYIDRDGDVHYSGVNFQGRALVDAVRVMNGTQEIWKVAESLYNADGNVLSQRRTTSGGTAWTEAAGDTRYSYLEEVIPAHSIHTVRPYYWARRGNVVYVLDRPRGGTVWDEVEGQPGTKVQSAGRYSSYGYDPFFNQVTFVESGNRTTSGTDEPTSRTHVVMDYQEYANASVPEFGAMLDELQSWGAQLRRTTNGYDWTFIRANQLFVDFHGVDVNGDGVVGGQSAVPVLIERQGGNFAQNPASEFTFLSWSAGGAPASVLSPDKTLTTFSYYHVEQPPRGQTDLPATGDIAGSYSGFLAAITTTRKSWPSSAGPARPSCAALPPQYRFLLRSCGADLPTSLAQLGLSPEAVEGVLSASAGKTTRFAYNAAGHVSAVRGPAGALTKSIADTDGRVRRTDLFAHAAPTAHSRVETEYDRFMRPYRTRRYTGTGESLGATLRSFDNDNRVLTECRETATGGCDSGGSPTHRTTQRWIYTREGDLFRHVDPEGLVTEYRRDGRKWVTLEKLISPVPGEGERLAAWTWDDDGNVQTRLYGTGSAVLSESMTWDGFGRRIGHVDTQGRRWFYGHSKRDLTVTSTHDSTSAPWSELFTWDSFGRLYSVEQNGLVTAEYWRLPGGLPFATSAAGRAPSFVTYDEVGRVVFAEDAAGNQSVSTETGASATSAHRITQSTIRKRPSPSLPLTTGTIATLDVLGLPSELREVGATLSRTTAVLARTGSGFVKRVRAPDGSLTEADYDFLGRILELRQQRAFGGVDYDRSTYSYNARGQLDTQVDPAGNTTVQRYTGFGDPLFKSAPASKPVESHWQYDALGRKVQHLVGNTVDLGYRYESATGRLEAIVRGDPSNTQAPVLQEFSYDELGRWTRSKHNNLGVGTAFGLVPESREVETSRTYDDAAQRYTETTRVGVQSSRTVTADWDVTVNNTWLRTLTLPDARTLTESFDFDGRQVGLGRANGGVTDFTWVDELLAETASTKTGTPLKRTVGFDGLAQPVSWNFTHQATGPSALTVDVRRDVMGRIGSSSVRFTTPSGSAPSWRGYAYDAMGRLSLVREAGAIPSSLPAPHQLPAAMESAVEGAGDAVSAERWAYAREVAVGSVLSISRTDVTATPPRFFAPANYQTPFGTPTARLEGHQLDSYEVGASGTRTVAHDEAGRVTSDGTQDFVYDDFGALVVVREAGGGAEKEVYLHDATGRLAAVLGPDGAGEVLTYDGAQAVQARTWAGAVAWTAAWGPGVDHLVSVEKEGGEYFALDDGKGSVVGWLDGTNNQVVGRAEYTPEGRGRYADEVAGTTCEEVDGARCPRPLDMPFGFHAAYASKTTGLLYFRNRWYSPEANQWLAQDPLDAVDSFNLYAFNGFDSVNFVDPWGLEKNNAVNQGSPGVAEDSGPPSGIDPGEAKPWSGRLPLIPYNQGGASGVGAVAEEGGGRYCFGPACGNNSFADATARSSAGLTANSSGGVRGGVNQIVLAYSSGGAAGGLGAMIGNQNAPGGRGLSPLEARENSLREWDKGLKFEEPRVPVPVPVPAAPRRQNGKPLVYYTYTKCKGAEVAGRCQGVVYSGRGKGFGNPYDLLKERDRNHHKNKEGFGKARLDKQTFGVLPIPLRAKDPAYQAIRGREQQLMDHFGGDRKHGGTSGNEIRGVAFDNRDGRTFHDAASNRFGELHPYSGRTPAESPSAGLDLEEKGDE